MSGSSSYHPAMATRDRYRNQRDPSEAQLRVMLEARQHELEAQRQRTSRTFSMILVVLITTVSGAIWLFPSNPVSSANPSQAVAAAPLASTTAVAPDLKPFTDTSGDATQDVKFAMELLNFVNPAATKSPETQAKATTSAEAAIKVIADHSSATP